MFNVDVFQFPSIAESTVSVIRVLYGVLLTLTLLGALPHAKRYFISEKWGGYGQSHWSVTAIQNPLVFPCVFGLWLLAALALMVGSWVVPAAFVNLIACWYFFVQMRWRGILRGMGAPGFLTFWLGAAVFVLEYTYRYAPHLSSLALFVLQIDFALIFLSAGIYKFSSGYRSNAGMELGLVNPQWGYWLKLWRCFPPNHWTFWTLNQLAWTTEIVGALLMLIPQTRLLGGMLILCSFIFIASQIRLGFLCEMVIVACLLFVDPDSVGADWLSFMSLSSVGQATLVLPVVLLEFLNQILVIGLWMYLLLLPIVRVGLAYNFYCRKRLPSFLQSALDKYTNVFGIIIWRVFSVDITNFFINVYEKQVAGGEERLVSRWGEVTVPRYNQVAESIAVTSIFTTLKYYASNRQLFIERLLRYARTLPYQSGSLLRFEYVSIVKQRSHFQFIPIVNYQVDLGKNQVTESVLSSVVSVKEPANASPVHEGAQPGSYKPEGK